MVQVAGGVVWNPKLGIAVVNQNHNSWSLPKGHLEDGENPLTAALREIEEETGIRKDDLTFISPLGGYERTQIMRDPSDTPEMRTITMYLFTTDKEALLPQDKDNPEARFVPIDEVSQLLTHPKDKEFFDSITNRINL